jgi:hypothetical protein
MVKTCPRCNKQHTKRGPYCSRSCGNVRVHTEADKELRSRKRLEWFNTPEGVATKALLSRTALKTKAKQMGLTVLEEDDYAIDIPSFDDEEPKINW